MAVFIPIMRIDLSSSHSAHVFRVIALRIVLVRVFSFADSSRNSPSSLTVLGLLDSVLPKAVKFFEGGRGAIVALPN